jgi:hypothetical protein
MVKVKDGPGGFRQMPGGLSFAVHHRAFHHGDDEQKDGQDKQKKGQGHRDDDPDRQGLEKGREGGGSWSQGHSLSVYGFKIKPTAYHKPGLDKFQPVKEWDLDDFSFSMPEPL